MMFATAGTRDFYPDDLRMRDWLFNEFTTVRCGAHAIGST
jgi:hypothetical protein